MTTADVIERGGGREWTRGGRLGRFVLLDKLGEGGMGLVVQAFDPDLDRKVAIKVLRVDRLAAGRAEADEAGRRLLREARAMAKIAHPNVVTVHEVGRTGPELFVVMDLVDGETLRSWLDTPRTWREVLFTFVRAGRGLVAAHAQGLVHRDFKPDNVLVGRDGRVHVTDFGLVGVRGTLDEADDPSLPADLASRHGLRASITHTGAVLGTPLYMAPEQHRGEPTDARSDQYSFCVALYEALYRQRPFAAGTPAELFAQAILGKVRPPPRERGIPQWLERVVLRGLSLDPADRHPSMEGLLAILERDPARARRRAMAVAGVTLAALLAVAGVWRAGRTDRGACEREAAAAARAVWGEPARVRVESALLRTGTPYAAQTWATTAVTLDAYVAGWVAAKTRACRATRVTGEQAAAQLVRRTSCLDRKLAQAHTLVELLAHAEVDTTRNAVRATQALGGPAACDSAAATRSLDSGPLRESVDRARWLRELGEPAPAIATIEPVVASSLVVEDKALVAEAGLAEGQALLAQGNGRGVERALFRAAVAAQSISDDETSCDAWTGLVVAVGVLQDRRDDALRWAELASSAVRRLGDDGLRAARIREARARVLEHAGDHDGALAELLESLATRERVGIDTIETADAEMVAAEWLASRANGRAAAPHAERSVQLYTRLLGPPHPTTSDARQRASAVGK